MNNKKILIVDDEQIVHLLLEKSLCDEGFDILHAYNGIEALEIIKNNSISLIFLDVLMPEMDGVETCQRIRKLSNVPVIFLTAKTAIFDKAMCFGAGGDDYITKPFEPNDVTLRVKAQIRRYNENSYETKTDILSFPPLTIDIPRHVVMVNNKQIPFTAKEFKILVILAQNPNRFFSTNELIFSVWNDKSSVDNNSFMSHISKIRKKLYMSTGVKDYISSVRNVGYKFNP